MKILVDQNQLNCVLTTGHLQLSLRADGDFQARMLSGKHIFGHGLETDPVAVICLSRDMDIDRCEQRSVFIGPYIREIHACVPCDFVPSFQYPNAEVMVACDMQDRIRAVFRALVRPRLKTGCPRDCYLQGSEGFDIYRRMFDNIVFEGGGWVDIAARQHNSGGMNDGISAILRARYKNDVQAMQSDLKTKWQ